MPVQFRVSQAYKEKTMRRKYVEARDPATGARSDLHILYSAGRGGGADVWAPGRGTLHRAATPGEAVKWAKSALKEELARRSRRSA